MKRCPECYEPYGDEAKFCEADGHQLLPDPAVLPKPEALATTAAVGRTVAWPAAALGVLIGVIFGAGVFAVAFMWSTPAETDQRPVATAVPEVHEKTLPHREVTASNSVPTPEPEVSPSPDSEQQAAAAPSPAANTENKTAAVRLNEGPISTGDKNSTEAQAAAQTVIEMTDGSTLNVDAAWEDKQGVWYRRSGLVSFVDSSRVKSISARRDTKVADDPHH
jgi:hypothetical protein